MSALEISEESKRRSYLTAIIVLLLLLLALLFLYYQFTKPPVPVGAPGVTGYRALFSIYGAGRERLKRPIETAVDSDGNIYVTDSENHRIMEFDSGGRFITSFGTPGQGPGQIWFPSGISIDADKNVYVLSKAASKITIFNPQHKVKWEITVKSPQTAVIKGKRMYLATYRGVMIGDLKGNLLTSFGRRGRAKGQVDHPGGIAVDKQGNIYVSDSLNYRLQAFDKQGKVKWILGNPPPPGVSAVRYRDLKFGLPAGLAIDKDGYLYLVDAFQGKIHVIDSRTGKDLKEVGDWGNEEGQFYYPAGITYAGNERFIVADEFNNRVQVITIPSPAPAAARAPLVRRWALYFLPIILLIIALLLFWRYLARRRIAMEKGQEAY